MRKMMIFCAALSIFFITTGFSFDGRSGHVKSGNQHMKDGDYEGALAEYAQAQIDDPQSALIHFNIGDALYRQNKFQEARASFEKTAESHEVHLQAKSLYNIGNALYRQGRLREALTQYKEALKRDPEDEDTKYNIEFVEAKIKEMMKEAPKTKNQAQQDQQKEQQKNQEQDQKQSQSSKNQNQENSSQNSQEDQESSSGSAEDDSKDGNEQKDQESPESEEDQNKDSQGENEPQPSSGQNEESEEDRSPEDQPSSGEMSKTPGELSKEQAEKILSMFDEKERSKAPEDEEGPQKRPYAYVEKYW